MGFLTSSQSGYFFIDIQDIPPAVLHRNHQREGNAAGADDLSLDGDYHGNGLLAALVDKCIKTEDILKLQWKCRAKSFTIDDDVKEVSLVSHKITKHTCEMAQVSGSEFPAAAIALKCITKETELMCQCIITGDSVISFAISNAVRQCALILMTCKDYVPAAAAMMGDQVKNNAKMTCTDHLRHRTLFIMLELCDECSAVAEPTVGDITGDLNSNESDNKLVDNGNHEERGSVSENKDSKKELARNDMDESNKTDENQNPNEKLGRNSLEKREVKPETKASTEKQVDLVGSSNEGDSSTSEEKKVDISKKNCAARLNLFMFFMEFLATRTFILAETCVERAEQSPVWKSWWAQKVVFRML